MIMDMSSTSHLGSTHSSPESFDDDTGMMGTANWQHMPPPVQTAPPSVAGSSTTSSAPTKVPLPLQKRRRVTRACDECRRKKIKCDGKQPCTHCTVYSYGSCIFSLSPPSPPILETEWMEKNYYNTMFLRLRSLRGNHDKDIANSYSIAA